ncbi:MAG: hypothetical protein IPI46_03205 [Bacteroidetes bacterium]|nr:hypothetical protein [Bacteroidota bacterium]
MKKIIYLIFCFVYFSFLSHATNPSVARIWNEVQLNAIRIDAARPPVQARNLFHVSIAMYDAWAVYDTVASTYLLGKTIGGINYPFTGVSIPSNIDSARNMAISYAAYRVLRNRYNISPNWAITRVKIDSTMLSLGYDTSYASTNYSSGTAADLGNYIAQKVIEMGYADGANQVNNYAGTGYTPNNPPLILSSAGNATMMNVNSWQPLSYVTCIDQNGNPCGTSTPAFVCPRWGKVLPFSMPTSAAITYTRAGQPYPVYFDPGVPPTLSVTDTSDVMSQYFKWGHSMVAAWSSHLDPNDTTMWDISPNGKGNTPSYPNTLAGQQSFYNFNSGGQPGTGYAVNPVTNLPYTPQIVKRGDYTRVVSQYWADGPTSETPPGHWFVLLNKASDYPGFEKKFEGIGNTLDDLEWDVKGYFTLGSAMHDAAIACWGIKGWYDSPRPISAIRKMAAYGQSSNPALPSFHPGGLALIPGYVELVTFSDPPALRGPGNINVNKIKLKSWKGFSSIVYSGTTPLNAAGVGWVLAENWMPYQRETFVTPPFAGYTSGHSTYSRSGAVTLTSITGSAYFPGGMGEYVVPANSNFIGFETSPTSEIRIQWATYKDASDEASLSRIWGGIHPPFDDMPARLIGEEVGHGCFYKAKDIFNNTLMSVSIVSNVNNPICIGTPIQFTATPVHAPSGTSYTWKRNGVVESTGTNLTYSPTSYANNDVIVCEMTSSGYQVASNSLQLVVSSCAPIALDVKLLLQGYYTGSGMMAPVLFNQGMSTDTLLCDSIDIELHTYLPPFEMIAAKKTALMRNGNATAVFTCPSDFYFVVIKHRNTIDTWSSEPILLGYPVVNDFTENLSFSYGENVKEVESGVWALFTGDINHDLNIDLLDMATIEGDINNFMSGYYPTDINGDGNVDLLDYPIPEENVLNFIYSVYP